MNVERRDNFPGIGNWEIEIETIETIAFRLKNTVNFSPIPNDQILIPLQVSQNKVRHPAVQVQPRIAAGDAVGPVGVELGVELLVVPDEVIDHHH